MTSTIMSAQSYARDTQNSDGSWYHSTSMYNSTIPEEILTKVGMKINLNHFAAFTNNGNTMLSGSSGMDGLIIPKTSITEDFNISFSITRITSKEGQAKNTFRSDGLRSGGRPFTSIVLPDESYQMSSPVTFSFYGVNASSQKILIREVTAPTSPFTFNFTSSEIAKIRSYNKLTVEGVIKNNLVSEILTTPHPVSKELLYMQRVAIPSSFSYKLQDLTKSQFIFQYNYNKIVPTPIVTDKMSETITLTGDPDTKITGATSTGLSATNHSLSISQGGFGIVTLTECNISNIAFSLTNCDLQCQTISSIILQDADGNVKKTFDNNEITTNGVDKITLSLLNISSISNNDKIQIALTNGCTSNKESDFTIILATEAKDSYGNYINTQLFPDKINKVPIAISKKTGTNWCDNSSAYFFNTSGTNGYTNIAYTNATSDGTGSYSVAKGQPSILGNATFGRCYTSISVPIPVTNMPKPPVISDLQYCNGNNFNLPINNSTDFSTEVFRLKLDGIEKVGWQGTKNFSGINIGKEGTAAAIVEATNGECNTVSNTATISSRINPIALAFSGSLTYYTQQATTTITQTTSQTGVTYKIYKDGSGTAMDTWTGSKPLVLSKGSYRITCENANVSCMTESSIVIQELNLDLGAGWSTSTLSFCQLEGNKNLNDYVSFTGATSITFTSTSGLSLSGSTVNLAASTPGTYSIKCTVVKAGLSNDFYKNFTVKAKAYDVAIEQLNATDFQCNKDDAILQVTTNYPGYTYHWNNGGYTTYSSTSRKVTVPVDLTNFKDVYARAITTEGCFGNLSQFIRLYKNSPASNLTTSDATVTYCQKIGGTADIFTEFTGSDKSNVINKIGGCRWVATPSAAGLKMTGSIINLETSLPGTYTVTLVVSNAFGGYCPQTFNKTIIIKQTPSAVAITLENASTIECDLTNPNALLRASYPNYTYQWYKNNVLSNLSNTANISIPVSKTDGLAKIYAIPLYDGCTGSKTNEVSITKRYVEVSLGFSTIDATFCQVKGGTLDFTTYIYGADRNIVINKQYGFSWTMTPSYSGLKMTGSIINLETSLPGTYTVTMVVSYNGCTKTYTKDIVIKQKPNDVTIKLTNSSPIECDMTNPDALVEASYPNYTYQWYKSGILISGQTAYSTQIPVSKADGYVNLYAVPYLDGCVGTTTNMIPIQKKYIDADVYFLNNSSTYCQKTGGTIDLATELFGPNRNEVVTKQNGYAWTMTSSEAGLSITGSVINLSTSVPGTYIVTFEITKNGCSKTITHEVIIKQMPNAVTITLENASTIECDLNNPNALIKADNATYTYDWYKNSTKMSDNTLSANIPVIKADGLTSIFAIPIIDGCTGNATNTIKITKRFVEAAIAFSSGSSSYCQYPKAKADIFGEITGADKAAIQGKQAGWGWSFSSSSTDLVIVGSQIDLELSKAGNYTITMNLTKDGCSKTLTKDVQIKRMPPSAVAITLENASTIECDLTNANALVKASHPAYVYEWYKKGAKLSDNTQSVSIPVSKADGLTAIYAIPFLDGCTGLKTNEVSLTKRFVEADVVFYSGVTEYCQKTGGSLNLFTELSGTDKIAVTNSQSGYTWVVTPSGAGLKMIGSVINLETSQAGTYSVTMVISKDGCTKTITKDVMIRQRPSDFTATLTNAPDFACNNSDAAFAATVTSYTYKWFKGGAEIGTGTTLNIPISKVDVSPASRTIYAIGTATNGCETNPSMNVVAPLKTFLEANIAISSGTATFCQTPEIGKTDVFAFLSGTDKLAVTTKQHFDWSITSQGIVMASPNEIDLQKTAPGTYTVSFRYQNDEGCSKTLTKEVVIKAKPIGVKIALENASTIECGLTSPNAIVKAENSAYVYEWYKKGAKLGDNTQSVSVPVTKADGLTAIYAIPFLDGCTGLKTNEVSLTKRFVETELAFTSGISSYCQYPNAKVDMFTELSGVDKLTIQGKESGWGWSFSGSSTDLVIVGSQIDLELSKAGTYTVTMVISKDGCTKTITKEVVIKRMPPLAVSIVLENASTIECDLSNANALVKASHPLYVYEWYKKGAKLGDNTQSVSVPVSKADGLTAIYAIPFLDGCTGLKTNEVSITKRFVEANIAISSGTATFCQKIGATKDIFTEISGADKATVVDSQNGYTWVATPSGAGLKMTGSVINLETSLPGTYTVTLVVSKDGCSKTFTKEVLIKQMPSSVSIVLENASTIECDMANVNALVAASNPLYVYEWYKKGVKLGDNTQSVSVPVSKADGLTAIYAIPFLDGCTGLKTNEVSVIKRFVEANLAFTAGTITYCQYPKSKMDMFTELAGTDKSAIQGKQAGWDWSFTSSSSDLVIVGSQLDLELSKAGTYKVNIIFTKDGCSKTLTKDVVIKQIPSVGAITLENASTIECDMANPNALVKAENSAYVYEWYKNGVQLSEKTQSISVPVIKADGLTAIYAIPFLDRCTGLKTNEVSITKRFVEANLVISSGTATFCQKIGGTADIFTETSGTDKATVANSQNGYTWVATPSAAGLKMTGSVINLETSIPGTYTVTLVVSKDGCSKTFTKEVLIKQMPSSVSVVLDNASTIECDMANVNALVTASNPLYVYEWYKKGVKLVDNIQSVSVPVSKADGLTAIYTIPFLDGCPGLKTNEVSVTKRFVEADLAFTSGISSYCQYPKAKVDMFTQLSGVDKLTIQGKESGWGWSFSSSSTDLVIVGSQLDLELSKAGTYKVNIIVTKDGCSKTLTKDVVIKQIPSAVSITLENASTIECDLTNPNAIVKAENSAYVYEWYKKAAKLSDNTQSVSIPVSKADGLTAIYAIPFLDGCTGLKTNEVSLTKRFVEADVVFSSGVTEYCQKTGGSLNIFTELSGIDKIAVTNSQSGYTWVVTPSGAGLKMTGSVINLETSQAGTYSVSMVISKDGCSKTITKDVMIRQRPADFTATLTNAPDFACNNSDAAFAATVTSYTYKWFKGGAEIGTGTTLNIPISKVDVSPASRTIYAIGTATNGCETNPSMNVVAPLKTFLEANIAISSGTATFCQTPEIGKTDVFAFLSGTDKLAVTTKQHFDWSITSQGIVMASPNEIDLQKTAPGTYTVSFRYQNDEGCSKTLTKEVVIKAKPIGVKIALENASTIECGLTSPNAIVKAENSAYVYEWYKKGAKLGDNTQSVSVPVTKADGLTAIYAIPFLDGCTGLKTNEVSLTKRFVETELAFTSGISSYCQYPNAKVDMFTELSGVDKLTIQGKESGWGWSFSGSSTDLVIVGSQIDLELSKAGTYTVTMVISKDGCTKTITKEVVIKRMPPLAVSIVLENASTIECDLSNANALVKASHPLYVYEWYKKGAKLGDNTQSVSVPVSKADGLTAIYAIPFLDGCTGLKTNEVSITKRFVEANIAISSGTATFCQKIGATKDIFTEISGADKATVVDSQNGYTWVATPSGAGLKMTGSVINLETSLPGTYTVTLVVSKDGCSKTFTKEVLIKQMPSSVSIVLENASTIECDMANVNALVAASNPLYVYEWYKKGVKLGDNTQSVSVPVSKADGLTAIYAIPFLDGCTGLKTNEVSVIKRFVEANLAFTAGTITYCQYPKSKMDMFTELAGTDKSAIQGKQAGWDWSFTSSSSDLVIVGSQLDLELSKAGTYKVNIIFTKDGCSKTLTKDVVIKQIPSVGAITLENASTIECDMANPNALVKAENSAYVYEWYKNGVQLSEKTQSISVPVIKADGLTAIYAIPFLDRCTGLKTNEVSITKRFVEANLVISSGTATFCQKIGGTADIFTETSGTDKATVANSQNGYTWVATPSAAGLKMTGSVINLETSIPGTYTVTLVVSKDGCSKTFTKEVLIKQMPSSVSVVLDNASTIECDMANVNALVTASNPLYVYEWYKKGVKLVDNIQSVSVPVSKADGLTAIYTIPFLDGCPGLKTNEVSVTKRFVEADLAFTSGISSYCQYPKAKVDMFTQLSGVDKLTIQGKESGWGWSFSSSSTDLVIVGSQLDLELSKAGTYKVNIIVTKDGCSKTLTKDVVIKQIPSAVSITLENASTIECDLTNPNAIVKAENSAYVYEWYKKAAKLSDNTQSVSIPVSKADGLTAIYAIPFLDGCTGLKTNEVSITKRFVEANLAFTAGTITYCQYPKAKEELFSLITGADKAVIQGKQSGWDWSFSSSSTDLVIVGSQLDLEVSKAGTYKVNIIVTKDGCTKTLTKDVVIKQIPSVVAITLENASTIECDLTNPNALVKAENSGYVYEWYKNGVQLTEKTQSVSVPVSNADGMTSIMAVPYLDGCSGLITNTVSLKKRFVEADLVFTAGPVSYCQYPKSKVDMFTELSGTDKLAIQGKQSGWGWSFSSSSDLVIVGSQIDLELSKAGTYKVNIIVTKDGCTKTLTKDVVIKQIPSAVAITLENASTVECDLTNPNALVKAENSTYVYEWYKKGVKLSDNTQSVSVPVSKADGLTAFYAIPFLDGCTGLKTNEVSLTKRFVESYLAFTNTAIEYCQKDNGTVDLIAAHMAGNDKAIVKGKTNGFDWKFVAPMALVINNGVVDLQKSASGSYDVNFVITKDGCEKVLSKTVLIKNQPGDIAISLSNNTDFACNTDAAILVASVKDNTYQWYKNNVLLDGSAAQMTVPVTKVDGITKFYAIGASGNGCASRTSNIITVDKRIVEADLAFTTGTVSYCQYPKAKVDMFTELSGTDKLAIQGKQSGWGWSFSSSSAELVIVGSQIDLELSKAGTYKASIILTKDGCTKTLTKDVVINPIPAAVTVEQLSDVTCHRSSVILRVVSPDNYTYKYYKNAAFATQNSDKQTAFNVTKADGIVELYTIPVSSIGCVGLKSNSVMVEKKDVEVNFGFNNNAIAVPAKNEAFNLFDYMSGTDKEVIKNQASGFTYKFAFNQVNQTQINPTDGTIIPSTGIHSGDTQYLLNVVISKDGCDTTLTKSAVIKAIPLNITIDFAQKKEIQECRNNNFMSVVASDPTLKYQWYKNDQLVAGDTYQASIEVFKSDKEVKIYAIPSTTDGVAGYKTNNLLTTKRYVAADLQLDSKIESFCSVAGQKINIFDYVRGTDKAAVLAGQYGYTYQISGDCGLAIAENKYIDFDNSLSNDNAVYNVGLTVAQNGCTTEQSKSITIKRRPDNITIDLMTKASNTANTNLFCGGDSLFLKASSSATGAVYNWYKEGALIQSTNEPNLKYRFADAVGKINLSATLTYSNGCASTASNVITVQKKDVNFSIDMAADEVAYCPESKRINLFDYVTGTDKNDVMAQNNNCSYEFIANGNNGLAIQNYSYLDLDNSSSNPAAYLLTFNVNKQGCIRSFTKNITIKPRPITPEIALTSNSELRFCGGDIISFADKNATTTGTNYKWTVNGTEVAGSGKLKYTTDLLSDLTVQTTAYFNSNSCPSKSSNILEVSNVRPQVDIKLVKDSITINENIQFYIFEKTPSKGITLTATRTSDKNVYDLGYTRNGSLITLKGVLPIGEYSFNAVFENALPGYCSQNVSIANKLTVSSSVLETPQLIIAAPQEDAAVKSLYDEYMSKLKNGEVHSLLLPMITTWMESSKLSIFTTEANESVTIRIVDLNGKELGFRSEFLSQGQNDFTIKATDKPHSGVYMIRIDYLKENRTEVLKGIVK